MLMLKAISFTNNLSLYISLYIDILQHYNAFIEPFDLHFLNKPNNLLYSKYSSI